ncbi:hypothetical protein [Candidatus Amarobacter glycogenicus]|uniref:hypothetical protein n=1 Tax=Candidatus Amarobacter glycogenicus TaxID=3140699 RepID=UPI0031CC57BA
MICSGANWRADVSDACCSTRSSKVTPPPQPEVMMTLRRLEVGVTQPHVHAGAAGADRDQAHIVHGLDDAFGAQEAEREGVLFRTANTSASPVPGC